MPQTNVFSKKSQFWLSEIEKHVFVFTKAVGYLFQTLNIFGNHGMRLCRFFFMAVLKNSFNNCFLGNYETCWVVGGYPFLDW